MFTREKSDNNNIWSISSVKVEMPENNNDMTITLQDWDMSCSHCTPTNIEYKGTNGRPYRYESWNI